MTGYEWVAMLGVEKCRPETAPCGRGSVMPRGKGPLPKVAPWRTGSAR